MTEEEFHRLKKEGLVIEDRSYNTVHGLWRYFMVEDKQLEHKEDDFLMIGVLQSYLSVRDYFGEEKVLPIFIDLDDGVRLERALSRERGQENPKYLELCRRYLADAEDFAPEKMAAAGIDSAFMNDDLEECIAKICAFIDENR